LVPPEPELVDARNVQPVTELGMQIPPFPRPCAETEARRMSVFPPLGE
jgi:hypothetical protein